MSFSSFFTTRQKKNSFILIFDIGSASVGAAFVALTKGEKPHLLYAVRKEMDVSKKINIGRFITLMNRALGVVITRIQTEGREHLSETEFKGRTIDGVYFIFSSLWHFSRLNQIVLEEKKEFVVTHDLLDTLIDKEIEEEIARSKNDESPHEEAELIEHKIVDLKLNGYRLDYPNGQRATSLEMLLFVSFVPKRILDLVKRRVHLAIPFKKAGVHSFVLSSFGVIRDIWNEKEDYLLVDITGEVTEILLVKDGDLSDTASFPMGRNSFLRKISKDLAVSFEEAKSLITMYSSHEEDENVTEAMKSSITKVQEEWNTYFTKILTSFSEGVFLPHHIFITGANPYVTWIKEIVSEQKNDLITKESFTINHLTSEKLANFVTVEGTTLRDPFLMIDILFIHKVRYPFGE